MIKNDDLSRKSNIEIAMERAREDGRRRDMEAAAAAKANIIHFNTDDIPGIDEIAAQYSGANTADFTHHSQIGVSGNGEPIFGETRVYIINEPVTSIHNSQEKDMNTNTKPQSEVEAAAQAAAQSAQPIIDEDAFNQELSDLIDKGMQEGQRMIDDLANDAGEAAANTLHKQPEPSKEEPKPETKQSGFKAFFFGLGKKAAAARIKIRKPAEKIELDQEAMLEEVKSLLAAAVKHVEEGMNKLPKGTFTPAAVVSNT